MARLNLLVMLLLVLSSLALVHVRHEGRTHRAGLESALAASVVLAGEQLALENRQRALMSGMGSQQRAQQLGMYQPSPDQVVYLARQAASGAR
ncbi:cell division protein FtsL [Ideonella livida]|uniref:Cell division protein FtsL n=1 Tax=Ideonella livida TaxID=2707176 RepID=A0A7C9PHT4_9BURK|nr:cell division protein FtsL [Ideonella livida]NDY92276.1 hypothetical protein [Ideonella livida]